MHWSNTICILKVAWLLLTASSNEAYKEQRSGLIPLLVLWSCDEDRSTINLHRSGVLWNQAYGTHMDLIAEKGGKPVTQFSPSQLPAQYAYTPCHYWQPQMDGWVSLEIKRCWFPTTLPGGKESWWKLIVIDVPRGYHLLRVLMCLHISAYLSPESLNLIADRSCHPV